MFALVRLQCHVKIPRAGDLVFRGWTSVIAPRRVEFLVENDPALIRLLDDGAEVYLDVELPRSHRYAPRCIHCAGRVAGLLRVSEESVRVTLRTESIGIREPDPAVRERLGRVDDGEERRA